MYVIFIGEVVHLNLFAMLREFISFFRFGNVDVAWSVAFSLKKRMFLHSSPSILKMGSYPPMSTLFLVFLAPL